MATYYKLENSEHKNIVVFISETKETVDDKIINEAKYAYQLLFAKNEAPENGKVIFSYIKHTVRSVKNVVFCGANDNTDDNLTTNRFKTNELIKKLLQKPAMQYTFMENKYVVDGIVYISRFTDYYAVNYPGIDS